MTKRLSAKHKISRRIGQNLWGTSKSPVIKRESGPGQHGARRKSKISDFGVQLRAKQTLKGYYGNINERQFRKIFAEANRLRGDTGENMIGLLERRLDAVMYRAKFAATPFAARQLVNHGHVKVNGRRLNVASALLKDGDVVELTAKAITMVPVLAAIQSTEREVPDYLETDHAKGTVKLTRTPKLSDVPYPVQMNPNLIIEFYSR
ncbi:MAG: 30S ribosomal protein S4 [Micropepsaceae bacterium]